MQNVISIGNLFHRNRERIRELGEVFTPDKYVEDMLDNLGYRLGSIYCFTVLCWQFLTILYLLLQLLDLLTLIYAVFSQTARA